VQRRGREAEQGGRKDGLCFKGTGEQPDDDWQIASFVIATLESSDFSCGGSRGGSKDARWKDHRVFVDRAHPKNRQSAG
jgi:hypothetical protein